jgi:hypothetical protein
MLLRNLLRLHTQIKNHMQLQFIVVAKTTASVILRSQLRTRTVIRNYGPLQQILTFLLLVLQLFSIF